MKRLIFDYVELLSTDVAGSRPDVKFAGFIKKVIE